MKQSNKLYISIIIGFIILGVAFLLYKNAKVERYETCKEEANNKYDKRWNDKCKSIEKEDNCFLPEDVGKYYTNTKLELYKLCEAYLK